MAMDIEFKKTIVYITLIILCIAILRLPTIFCPFYNVDEGVSAVIGNTILDGGIVYRDAIDHRGPITYFIYALIFSLFGRNNMVAVHFSLILLILLISIILFLISSLAWNRRAGYFAALFFGIFSYAYSSKDMWAFHTEWCAVLFSTIGAYFFIRFIFKSKTYFLFLSGVFFGLSFFSKQTALLDYLITLLFCGIFVYFKRKSIDTLIKPLVLMTGGFFIITIIFVYYFYINNALNDFWFYFWQYNTKYYLPAVPVLLRIKLAFGYLLNAQSFLGRNYLLLVFFVCASFIAVRNFLNNYKRLNRELVISFYLICWAIFSYIGAVFTGRNFGHYFIMTLPSLCLLSGKTIEDINIFISSYAKSGDYKNKAEAFKKYIIKIFLMIFLIVGILYSLRPVYWMRSFKKLISDKNEERRFLLEKDLVMLTEYIIKNSSEHDKILIWGFYPQIYILAKRMPATRYTYSNFLTGMITRSNAQPFIDTPETIVPGTWKIFIDELGRNKPIYIVDTSVGNHYGYGIYPPDKFSDLNNFLKENYIIEKEFFNEEGAISFRLFKRNK